MGNWHCVPSNCAEVVYQKYEPPLVRWRYPNEAWQEIEGNDYAIKENIKQGQNNYQYWVDVKRKIVSGSSPGYYINDVYRYVVYGPIQGIKYDERPDARQIGYGTHPNSFIKTPTYDQLYAYLYARNYANEAIVMFLSSNAPPPDLNEIEIVGIYPRYGENDTNNKDCTFTIYQNNQIVHQETRAVCPEVEKIPCKLSNVRHSIEIKKLPFLEKIEVVPYQYSAYRAPGVPAPIVQADQIPAECLNIYNNAIYVIPPSGQGIYPNATPFDSFVAQICSYPGCPPPEYQVICDCNNCQSCPDNTCPIECNGNICCYNDYGVSIKEIPLSNYCGGQS